MTDVVIFADQSWELPHFGCLPARGTGPHLLKTIIRNSGYTCELIDFIFYFTNEEIYEFCKKFITKETLVVGFSTTYWYYLDEVKKQKFLTIYNFVINLNGPKIVVGGTEAVKYPSKIKIDACFKGFSEDTFLQYIDKISNNINSRVPFNFNHSFVEYTKNDCLNPGESVTIEIARGCIFKCHFCAFPLTGKKQFDYIKDENILREELTRNFEQNGITNYTFSDDTFNDSTYKLEKLHKLFSTLPFKINFVSYLRLDLMHTNKEQIPLLKELGLIGGFFGVETFHKPSGSFVRKGFDPEKNKELLYELKKSYWKEEVNLTIGLISGLPFETKESHEDTLRWIESEYCTVDRIRPMPLFIVDPKKDYYPNQTEFQVNAAKYGYYWENDKYNWKNKYHEVNSFEMAKSRANELTAAASKVNKTLRGNFGLPWYYNLGKFSDSPKTITELQTMPLTEFSLWLDKNKNTMRSNYMDEYKNKKMAL